MPGPAISQGQTVALLLAAAGVALLLLALALDGRSRPVRVETRARSVLVGVLLMSAGLALLLVQRLDPAALARVAANLTAALSTAAGKGRPVAEPVRTSQRRSRRHHAVAQRPCSPHDLLKELS